MKHRIQVGLTPRIPATPMTGANYTAPSSMQSPRELEVPSELAGLRLDQALARLLPEHSRSRIKAWIDAGGVSVDGAKLPAKHRLLGAERVRIAPLPEVHDATLLAQALPLSVVYEDEAIIVIDKPASLVVHPGAGNREGTLANALLHHAQQLAALPRAGIVHRLDKDTSGLLVVAKTETAQRDLIGQLQARTVRREYLALVQGVLARGGDIDAPIGRHPVRRTAMAVLAKGKRAITHYEVRERFAECTLLDCRLETGRTHQIRVHFASLRHPLVGDPVYGKRHGIAFHRQALHAWRLGLTHPVTRRPMRWESSLPPDFAALLESLRRR